MESVVSADGTEIGYATRGSGRPLMLLHGTAGSNESWRTLPGRFADDHRVLAVDRRGRGASGDGDDYSLDREVADVHAVLDAVDGDPVLFGHSYGGLVALEAARDVDLTALVLYEPAMILGDAGTSHAARMRDRLDTGDREGAVELFFRGLGGDALVEEMPIGAVADIAETVVLGFEAVGQYRLDDPDPGVPTLLLAGETTPGHIADPVEAVADRVDDARVETLANTGHHGLKTASARVEAAVRSFLDDVR